MVISIKLNRKEKAVVRAVKDRAARTELAVRTRLAVWLRRASDRIAVLPY